MQRSFLRCHLLAWMGGVVFAWIGACLLNAIPLKLLFSFPFIGPVLPIYVVVTMLEIFIAWKMAALLGVFDALLIVPFALTVALGFGMSYSTDVHTFPLNKNHGLYSIGTWGAHPFNFWGQLEIFTLIFAWTLIVLGLGTILNRRQQTGPEFASPPTLRWLSFDLILIVCATVAILRTEVVNRIAEGNPENIYRAAALVLQSKTSPPGDHAQAIMKLAGVTNDDATDRLRHAAREEPEPINLLAAAELLGRDDMLGLSILKDHLMQASPIDAGYSTTRKSMMGDSVSGFNFQINLDTYLGHIKDPAALPILVELMRSPKPEIRRGAIQGMRNIKPSPLTVDALVTGLYDSDETVRNYAMWGLIVIMDRDKATYGWERPSHHFVSRQDDLDSLKAWASRNGLGQGPY